jgi:hypothetical protein
MPVHCLVSLTLAFSFYASKVLLILDITGRKSSQIIGLQISLWNPTIVAENPTL